MTLGEIEIALKKVTDDQIVQDELLNRLEQVVERNTEAIAQNSAAIGHLADGMVLMQPAMDRLFDYRDRFIRGLEGDGHRGA